VTTLTPDIIEIIRADLARANITDRAGLRDPNRLGPAVYRRHGQRPDWMWSSLDAAKPQDRCACTAVGGRCALLWDGEDLLCPACRIACTGQVTP
jgi:hypothetical protein